LILAAVPASIGHLVAKQRHLVDQMLAYMRDVRGCA
jgi:hypothetical protein